MKKVTIITPPEYEGLILESLGRSQVIQFKKVTGTEYEALKDPSEEATDYKILYNKINIRYEELLKTEYVEVERKTPSIEELREFTISPERKVDSIIDEASSLIEEIEEKQERLHVENNKLVKDLQAELDVEREKFEAEKQKLLGKLADRVILSTRLESIQALEPEQFRRSFAVGVVKNDLVPNVGEYLKRYEGTYYRTAPISDDESFIFVFGTDDTRRWVEALFLVFDIKDIFDALDSRDLLLVLDPSKRAEAIEKYKAELKTQAGKAGAGGESDEENKIREKVAELESIHRQQLSELRAKYDLKIKENEEAHKKEIADLMSEQSEKIGKIDYFVNLLKILSHRRVHVLRGMVISVLQGYTPDSMVPQLREAVKDVENEIGENLFIEISDLGDEDEHAPTPEFEFKPSFLQPAWILTRLRGWPSAQEINPGIISVLIFCFQFGLMFGDIGQGAIFLILGYFISKKFDSGMMKYLGTLFIPMGVSAIIFGFMYDSIFLIEHAISHQLHEAHIHLPFEYPIMPNPVTETTTLMKLVFTIAAIEVILSLILGAINQIKSGNPIGALGEHGLGMILYVTGFYITAMHFIRIGMDFMAALGHWSFNLVLAGLALSFLEPIIHSVKHGHGVSIEAIGEGVGGLMMTFVEGLANLFSFLRIAAFALAHTSLAIAAEALTHALHIPGVGLILMNIIALSFEFVSSSVQSLRLLYYEFMGKFFQGGGIPFRPYRIRRTNP